jgi:hypothetical protein
MVKNRTTTTDVKGGKNMIDKRVKVTPIYKELEKKDQDYWFEHKRDKYINNIDTLYYSIDIDIPFAENKDEEPESYIPAEKLMFFKQLRHDQEIARMHPDDIIQSNLDYTGYDTGLIVRNRRFVKFYEFCIEALDDYVIFIAQSVPNNKTPLINVHLSSRYLWRVGAKRAVEESFARIERILNLYDIKVNEVKMNRVDYCYHTNYIQNPERFLDLKHVAKMRVSRIKKYDCYGEFVDDEAVNDYIRIGRLKSNNLVLRIYNKSREVVEMGYKGFFFLTWFFKGLISRYDLYCYEYAYKLRSWYSVDRARLQFYIDYGKNDDLIALCVEALDGDNLATISALANKLTPKVTLVVNVEFQVMRKFLASLHLENFAKNKGPLSMIRTELDNTALITDYLTSTAIRFVKTTGTQRKQDRPLTPFWDKLRKCRIEEFLLPPEKVELVRKREETLNKEALRMRYVCTLASCAVATGKYNIDMDDDSQYLLDTMTDNEYYGYARKKRRKIDEYNQKMKRLGFAGTSTVPEDE